jgi:hypothetical protein
VLPAAEIYSLWTSFFPNTTYPNMNPQRNATGKSAMLIKIADGNPKQQKPIINIPQFILVISILHTFLTFITTAEAASPPVVVPPVVHTSYAYPRWSSSART